MVFQLVVETEGELSRSAACAAPTPSNTVFETFLGPSAEEELPQPMEISSACKTAIGGKATIDERRVKGVRLFRTGGLGGPGTLDGRKGRTSFEGLLPVQRTRALLLVAVPAEVSLKELLQFFGDSVAAVENVRVFYWGTGACEEKESDALSGDFYAVVLLCCTQSDADAFYQEQHGRILRGTTQAPALGGSASAVSGGYPQVTATSGGSSADPATSASGGPCCYLLFLEGIAYRELHKGTTDQGRCDEMAPMEVPQAAVELPMCPFCLERLDFSVTGMVTHNAGWLSSMAWDEVPHSDCCRACAMIDRAGRIIAGMDNHELGENPAVVTCQRCERNEELWVCLVCGYLGCGRYASGHAKDHAREQQHGFCLDLLSGRIWDYAGDVFVHRRLVQMAAASGRFEVALPAPAEETTAGRGPDKVQMGAAQDYLAMELDAVLASQLDYQRTLYEAKLQSLEDRHRQFLAETQAQQNFDSKHETLEASIAEAERERRALEKKYTSVDQARKKAEEELQFVKELNRSLLANRTEMNKAAQAKVQETAKEPENDALVQRLKEQVTQLMAEVSALGE